MMIFFACGVLLIGVFLFIFSSKSKVETQQQKTRLAYLYERKEVLYDNLRDLNFEYRAGKYPEEDYETQRAALENEAAEIVAEIDCLESKMKSSGNAAKEPA